jgi:hypothetical protein
MRYRERQKQGQGGSEDGTYTSRGASVGFAVPPRVLVALLMIVVLAGLGWGAYQLFAGREPRLTADAARAEFEANTEAANKKYRGKFVQVTGKVKVYKIDKAQRYFFEMPATAKWGIELGLQPRAAAEIKDGEEITVRGRFAARKGENTNVLISNPTIISK